MLSPQGAAGADSPATRTFQALRIAVNDELGCSIAYCSKPLTGSSPRGFWESSASIPLEDRRVKTAFLRDERLQRITRKPVVATEQEEEANPRSRSAKWRVAQRLTAA